MTAAILLLQTQTLRNAFHIQAEARELSYYHSLCMIDDLREARAQLKMLKRQVGYVEARTSEAEQDREPMRANDALAEMRASMGLRQCL
jgi:hypothetical protein